MLVIAEFMVEALLVSPVAVVISPLSPVFIMDTLYLSEVSSFDILLMTPRAKSSISSERYAVPDKFSL